MPTNLYTEQDTFTAYITASHKRCNKMFIYHSINFRRSHRINIAESISNAHLR